MEKRELDRVGGTGRHDIATHRRIRGRGGVTHGRAGPDRQQGGWAGAGRQRSMPRIRGRGGAGWDLSCESMFIISIASQITNIVLPPTFSYLIQDMSQRGQDGTG